MYNGINTYSYYYIYFFYLKINILKYLNINLIKNQLIIKNIFLI